MFCSPDREDPNYRSYNRINSTDEDDRRVLDNFISDNGTLYIPCGVTELRD